MKLPTDIHRRPAMPKRSLTSARRLTVTAISAALVLYSAVVPAPQQPKEPLTVAQVPDEASCFASGAECIAAAMTLKRLASAQSAAIQQLDAIVSGVEKRVDTIEKRTNHE